jgi:pseudouridine kinase
MKGILCIGGTNWDQIARADVPVVLGTSNPASVSHAAGGVARNVAAGLKHVGLDAGIYGYIGRDQEGTGLRQILESEGINISLLRPHANLRTATYNALVGPDGRLVVAWADMAVHEALGPADIDRDLPELVKWPYWFVETNLSALALAHLADRKPDGCTLICDAVSVVKAPRLIAALSRIDLLFCNRDEAAALTGGPGSTMELAQRLVAGRPNLTVVVTSGRDGLAVRGPSVSQTLTPQVRRDMVADETGAGDALISGTIAALYGGSDLISALRVGMAAADRVLSRIGA